MDVALSLGLFGLAWLLQVATPGPSFVCITRSCLQISRSAAMTTASGTATGNGLLCLLAGFGAAALTANSAIAGTIRLAGAAYLLFFGLSLIAGLQAKSAEDADLVPRAIGIAAYRQGLMTALSNPQAIAFFATGFVSFLGPASPLLVTATSLMVVGITLGWYFFATTLLANDSARQKYQMLRPWIDGTFGILLLTAALRLVVTP